MILLELVQSSRNDPLGICAVLEECSSKNLKGPQGMILKQFEGSSKNAPLGICAVLKECSSKNDPQTI